jgi:hypothetical protein
MCVHLIQVNKWAAVPRGAARTLAPKQRPVTAPENDMHPVGAIWLTGLKIPDHKWCIVNWLT